MEEPRYATTPLFCSLDRRRQLTDRRLDRREALAMIKRRAKQAGLSTRICNHTGRATGITNFLVNGGSLEDAQRIAGHASAKTTKGYDHSDKALSQTEIERIDYFRKSSTTPNSTHSTSNTHSAPTTLFPLFKFFPLFLVAFCAESRSYHGAPNLISAPITATVTVTERVTTQSHIQLPLPIHISHPKGYAVMSSTLHEIALHGRLLLPQQTIIINLPPTLQRVHPPTEAPEWDPQSGTLSYRGSIIKRFSCPATNQRRVLAAFQEEGWPKRIDDPLPPAYDLVEPRQRVRSTTHSLNRNQHPFTIRFRSDGTGRGFLWELKT